MAFAITSLRASPSSKAPAPLSEFQIRQGLLKEELALLKRSEEHTSELQSHSDLVCRLLLEKKKKHKTSRHISENDANVTQEKNNTTRVQSIRLLQPRRFRLTRNASGRIQLPPDVTKSRLT